MLEKLKEYFDEYDLKARIYPSLIALAPLFILFYFALKNNTHIKTFTNIFSSITLTIIVMFLISEIVRSLGKVLEKNVFGNELSFPSTEILLHKDITHMSKDRRIQIYEKIETDFGISLPTQREETEDENTARQKIKEAIGSIRQKVGNGRLLLQYNIRYGFWRNLIGVSWCSSLLCIFNIIFLIASKNNDLIILSLSAILLLFYSLIFFFKKSLLNFFGYQYAEQLFLEYLNLSNIK